MRTVECSLSDASGNFAIPARPVRYQISVSKEAAGYHSQGAPFFRHPEAEVYEVTLSGANRTPFVSISLSPKNGTLIGKSIDAGTGRPIENTRFIFVHATNPKISWATGAKSSSGEFKLPAPHVPFTVVVTADEYEDWHGLSGSNRTEPNLIPSGTSTEVIFYLKRKKEFVRRPLHESEKDPSLNLPAPVLLNSSDGVRLDHFPRVTKLEWELVEGAVSYSVEVDYCDGRTRTECVNPQPHTLKLTRRQPASKVLVMSSSLSVPSLEDGAFGRSIRTGWRASKALGARSSI